MNYAQAIKQWRTKRRLTQAQLGELCGYEHAQSRIANYESISGKNAREPSFEELRIIAKALGLGSVPELLLGPDDDTQNFLAETGVEYDAHEYVGVALLDGFLSMGPGGQDVSPEVMKYLHFRKDWIRAQGWRPGALWAISSRGESMPGLVDDLDVMLVNADDRWPKNGRPPRQRVFAIKSPNGDLAKELFYDERTERLTVRSWNPDKGKWPDEHYSKDDIDNSLFVMGRVVWRGGIL